MIEYNKQNALAELLDVINKGIDLLASNYLEQDLYNAYERYALSTLQLVDAAFLTTYSFDFSNNSSRFSSLGYPNVANAPIGLRDYLNPQYLHSARDIAQQFGLSDNNNNSNNISNLKLLLQRLVSIMKTLILR